MLSSHVAVEGSIQTSRPLTHRVLLDEEEMESLFAALPPFQLYNIAQIVEKGEELIEQEAFLASYKAYVASLKGGEIPDSRLHKPYFSAALSSSSDALYAMEVKGGRRIVKIKKPVVQMSAHHFTFSPQERAFYSMIHSDFAISWGAQFSYPQLYSNTIDDEVVESFKDMTNPNTLLFKALMRHLRTWSKPARFAFGETVVTTSFRLGLKAKEWIGRHAQLSAAGLTPCL